ncbi:SMI1/KNR4 family protein [Streptomyces sp. NPDC056930]|uniref:SMI1/KNR4 family protein n=1 Tax=Streptomyces sp. NPDC056930 TaxID=3345967 RepID=UPI00362CAE2C
MWLVRWRSCMSEMATHEAEEVRQAWGRVTRWLEQHDPGVFAGLGGPGCPAAISDAEERMGLKLPREMWQWLLANDIGGGRQPAVGSCLVALGCEGVIPSGGLLLGLTDIERVYLHKMGVEEMEPSGDPDYPSWRREWVPIAAESDGFYGRFLSTRTGSIGSWTEGSDPEEGTFASLSAFFQDAANHLEGVSSGNARENAGGSLRDRGRGWCRACRDTRRGRACGGTPAR